MIRIQTIQQDCTWTFAWDGWYVDMFYDEDDNPALIADIHTNPNPPGQVLHVATGPTVPICLVAETDEGATMYVGPAFTYYDVIEEGFPPVRLTDKGWRARLGTAMAPDHPMWTDSFLISDGGDSEVLNLPRS